MKTTNTRRDFLKGLCAGGASLLVTGCGSSFQRSEPAAASCRKTGKPNILFIMSDDHAAHAISSYGGRLAAVAPTKNIDQLAAEGMLLENCFCTNAICTPSRASIITGQYSQANGVRTFGGRVQPKDHYLPLLMSEAGYNTAMIGKWHLYVQPSAFDYYKVLPGQGEYYNPAFYEIGSPWEQNPVKYTGYVSDVVTDISLDWLENKRDKSKPFFLMHHFKAPHDMFENAPRFDSLLEDIDIPEPASLRIRPVSRSKATEGQGSGSSVSKRCAERNIGSDLGIDQSLGDEEYTTKAYQLYLKRYLRCVAAIDENIGRLIDYLKKENLYDNTVIIYTADQGMMLGEHDYIDKRWMYEESLRMPFIVRYPKMIAPGGRCDEIVNNTDFAPTMLDLVGIETPDYMHGRSFVPLLKGNVPADWPKSTYYRYWLQLSHHFNPAHFGIRTKQYKLIFFYGCTTSGKRKTTPAWELYDMINDPYEMNNLYGDPQYARVTKELKAELLRIREEFNETDEKYPSIQEIIDTHWND